MSLFSRNLRTHKYLPPPPPDTEPRERADGS